MAAFGVGVSQGEGEGLQQVGEGGWSRWQPAKLAGLVQRSDQLDAGDVCPVGVAGSRGEALDLGDDRSGGVAGIAVRHISPTRSAPLPGAP